jgi:hypothetical protein
MGKVVDIDNILLKNEEVIAIGNMKVNARGDELGPGGKIVRTRDQIMKAYYALNTPVAVDSMEAMADNVPQPVKSKPMPVTTQVAVEAPIPVVIDANSGIDDNDEGPVIAAVVDKPIEEVLAAPVVQVIQPAPTPAPVKLTPRPPPVQVSIVDPEPVPYSLSDVLQGTTSIEADPAPVDIMSDPSLTALKPKPMPRPIDVNAMPPVAPVSPIRGSLASAVANTTTITQKELLPPNKANGIQRF